jgi:hypothetical protein
MSQQAVSDSDQDDEFIRQPGDQPFPFVWTGFWILGLLLCVGLWAIPGGTLKVPALLTLVALMIRFTYGLCARWGWDPHQVVAIKFEIALLKRENVARIGGVRWCIVGDQFYRVTYDSGDRGIGYDSEQTRAERGSRELNLSRWRKWGLYAFLLFILVCAKYTYDNPSDPSTEASIVYAGIALIFVAWEFLYRRGAQYIPGAMVLDPDPNHISREAVHRQMAHGDAGLAVEAQTLAAAAGDNKRGSSIHDQEF